MSELILGLSFGAGGGALLAAAIVLWLGVKRDERKERKK